MYINDDKDDLKIEALCLQRKRECDLITDSVVLRWYILIHLDVL
jgi:hypothetical protein